MRGEEPDESGGAAPRQPAAVLAGRIERQLAGMRAAQVARIVQLRETLGVELFRWDDTGLAQAVSAWHSAGRQLHFQRLRQGWVARLLGRHRERYAQFIAAHERTTACAAPVKAQLLALTREHGEQGAALLAARQGLSELEAQWQQLNAAVDEGVTWLQDMCTQLSDARMQGQGDPQLAALAEAAQRFTQEFKRLQSVGTIAHDIAVRGNNVMQRRAALLAGVRVATESFDKVWTARLAPLVAALREGRSAKAHIPKAAEAHDELMKRLAAGADACGALQHEEHLLAEHLDLLQREIDAPRDQDD
jgi:hypothetical protein